jgi:methylenetetrahydrofolate reductase (NADPH)
LVLFFKKELLPSPSFQWVDLPVQLPENDKSRIPCLLDDFSIEMTANDVDALREAQPTLPPGTLVAITFLPGETMRARVAAAARVKQLGFQPAPHISARRLENAKDLEDFLRQLIGEAGPERVFVVAGDLPAPAGPYEDALAVIRTGILARYGIRRVGISGYPEGHPGIADAQLWYALREKYALLRSLGHEPVVLTQFAFDADPVLAWLERLRTAGIDSLVRVGIPGPANVKTLLRFATRCGVATSANVMSKYGLSITRLFGTAGPDKLLRELALRLDPSLHGNVKLHFYPFGGLRKTAEWAASFRLTA